MRERTPLDDLQLQGSPNLRRAQQREKAEQHSGSLSAEVQGEVDQITELIALAMRACRRGQTFDKRPNPAFANLERLVKARHLLMRGKNSTKKSTKNLLAAAESMTTAPLSNGVN